MKVIGKVDPELKDELDSIDRMVDWLYTKDQTHLVRNWVLTLMKRKAELVEII